MKLYIAYIEIEIEENQQFIAVLRRTAEEAEDYVEKMKNAAKAKGAKIAKTKVKEVKL